MRVVVIGADVHHTLIALKQEDIRRPTVSEAAYPGGAALLRDLIARVTAPTPVEVVHASNQVRTFAACRQYPIRVDPVGAKAENVIWRIDKLLGQTEVERRFDAHLGEKAADLLIMEIPHVIDVAGNDVSPIDMDLQGEMAEDGWAVIKTEAAKYIGSRLFQSVNRLARGRQIVVMSLSTVRRLDNTLFIGALSWESTADAIRSALARELTHSASPQGTATSDLPHSVLVSIMNDGAVCLRCEPSGLGLTLIYDPKSIEGEWVQFRPGRMAGYTQCLVAAVAAGVAKEMAAPAIEKYVHAGIQGGRKLHEIGYQFTAPVPFPTGQVAEEIQLWLGDIANLSGELPKIRVQNCDEVNWSILKRHFSQHPSGGNLQILGWPDVRERLMGLVKAGISESFRNVPAVSFDKFTAVSRDEIETLRAVRGLMREYGSRRTNKRPLSIAVFGAPGSGKSFAVKSVAKSIHHSLEFETLEFNLSQFSEPGQLYGALHQVRDCALSGKMPLVFWDEFDCAFHGPYGWLRYFLAPMQDGKFTQGQTTHSVGNAVFVFAGGTSQDVQTFRERAERDLAAKGPDFLSRLHGFLNVAGLNHAGILLCGVLVRRAVLLRELLLVYATGINGSRTANILDIDDSVITAFLCVQEFRFGARSVEAILQMSRLEGKNRFEPSCLPPADQIDLHVNSSEWLSLLDGTAPILLGGDANNPLIGW